MSPKPTWSLEETAGSPFPIVDSHIHLFPESHLKSLAWCAPGGPLDAQYSIDEYRKAIHQAPLPTDGVFKGFVIVEADCKSSLSEETGGWEAPLEELKFLGRVVEGKPARGEGHRSEDARLCRAIVGWAPVPAGRAEVSRYVGRAQTECGDMMLKWAGVRYLVQDKPRGTMLQNGFIDSLKYLGENGWTFDLGVDCRSGGLWQLEEAAEMISRAIEGVQPEHRTIMVINHMCKPDMHINPLEAVSNERFLSWKAQIATLAAFPNTYMKISGAFSEMPPLPAQGEQESMSFWERTNFLSDAGDRAAVWLRAVLEAFSAKRLMFGSDWPVCNIHGGGNDVAFKNWALIVKNFVSSLDRQSQAQIYGLNAEAVYGSKDGGT